MPQPVLTQGQHTIADGRDGHCVVFDGSTNYDLKGLPAHLFSGAAYSVVTVVKAAGTIGVMVCMTVQCSAVQ